MKEVLIHIGHGKTGTSYVQSVLAINKDRLAEFGILYPENDSLNAARAGKITSGNISFREAWPKEVISSLSTSEEIHKIVFSSEFIFHRFFEDMESLNKLKDMCNLKILMFVRNPIEMAMSSYGQDVKRAGETCTPDEYLFKDIHLNKSLDIIKFLKKENINHSIYNYSNHRDELIKIFSKELAVYRKMKFSLPRAKTVNRSLTRSEMVLQKRLNELMGNKSSKIFSDEMCQGAPEVPSTPPILNVVSIEKFRDQNASVVDEVNSYIPRKEMISLDYSVEANESINLDDVHSFSTEQLNIIADVLCREAKNNFAAEAMVDTIRDIALKMERTGDFSTSEVRSVMRIAHIFRPEGAFISQKMKEYDAKCSEASLVD